MRIIPKKTKIAAEFFRGVSIWDILVGFFGVLVMFMVFLSSLPGKLWIEVGLLFVFGLLLVRIDDEPNYMFLIKILRHFSYRRFYRRKEISAPQKKEITKQKKGKMELKGFGHPANARPAQSSAAGEPNAVAEPEQIPDSALDSDTSPDSSAEVQSEPEPQDGGVAVVTKAEPAEPSQKGKRKNKGGGPKGKKSVSTQSSERKIEDVRTMTLVNKISDGVIRYGSQYFGAVIEIPSVEFRFFSPTRRTNSIDRALGSVIRSASTRYAANLVKLERPMILDDYILEEKKKIQLLRRSYERGVFSEDELQNRVEVILSRISSLDKMNRDDQILVPRFYLVLFDSDIRQLNQQVQTAVATLQQGEMDARRLDDKELAVFLRYSNSVDFDERDIERISPEKYADFSLPESIAIKHRTVEVNRIITHNFRVTGFPLTVPDAWGASLFDQPGTKVVMKFSQMDRDKSIRAIDRSIGELNSQLNSTNLSSRILEIQTHIESLSELLVMLQNNNETLLAMNLYVTAYDIALTREQMPEELQPPPSMLPRISSMKRSVKRNFSELGFKLSDLSFEQFEGYVATQVNGYDPFGNKARGIPSSTVAAVFPWVYGSMKDDKGLNLGSVDGVPAFVDFFRRDTERVNSNMVIIGKSGSGKSYATKSLLTNLAADDTKIFVLDPEGEYTELAANLKGKFINVANSTHGRINPFQIITSLEDDDADSGDSATSFSAHLQFLEEFFRQILPDMDTDSMEYLNSLINRVYLKKNIDSSTNLATLKSEDYPVFDDLYDCILEEFQRTKSEYLKSNLRVLMNYVAKFSTGGRNSNIWNGPSTLSTAENFTVFNFQTLLANRNNTIANAQMLLVLKYLDNEIIKNREYNQKYNASRKIVVVIDEAHVFIDSKYPLALDFMYQMAKRIRKYNGMQIVITQNIKDFVGSEELARKSTAIINACQYSLIFALSPNDMHDLCTLYEKAGGINESEQEQIINSARGSAFVVTGPTSRARIDIHTSKIVEDMFSKPSYSTTYFGNEKGREYWESLMEESRERRQEWDSSQPVADGSRDVDNTPVYAKVTLVEMEEAPEEEEILLVHESAVAQEPVYREPETQPVAPKPQQESVPAMDALQRLGMETLIEEIRRTVRQEVERELTSRPVGQSQNTASYGTGFDLQEEPAQKNTVDNWFAPVSAQETEPRLSDNGADDWFLQIPDQETEIKSESKDSFGSLDDWFTPVSADPNLISAESVDMQVDEHILAADEAKNLLELEPKEVPLVYEVTLEEFMRMTDYT